MIPNLLLHLSDWNAQFFREVRGRLQSRNLTIAVGSSLLVQAVIMLYFVMLLPGLETTSSRYCTGPRTYVLPSCVLNATGNLQINWVEWWSHVFQALSWTLPCILLVAGVYLLISDLAKEERRGTLNFIRLSPQTSQSILIGKLLGVPLLPFLGVVLAVPLHVWAAIQAGISSVAVISIYLMTITTCAFLYSGSILYAFLGGTHNWLGAVTVFLSYTIFFRIWEGSRYLYNHPYPRLGEWYHIHLSNHLVQTVSFVVVTMAIATYWIWRAINRCFRNPNRTLISKRQSYFITLSFEIFIFGFVFHNHETGSTFNNEAFAYLAALILVNLFWFLLITAALTPHRQTLLDWARYHHSAESTVRRKEWKKRFVKDLVLGEKSPALMAIALNLLIPIVLFTPWIMMWNDGSPRLLGFMSLVFQAVFLLICAAIVQLALFMSSQKRVLVATCLSTVLIGLPPAGFLFFNMIPNEVTGSVWLFSAFAFAGLYSASTTTIALSFLAHLGALATLTARLTRQLQRAGESELKALMARQSA